MKWSFILCLLAVYSVQALPNLDKEVDINEEENVAESNKKFEKTVEVNSRDKREVGDDPMPEDRVKRESGPEPPSDLNVDVDVNINVPGDNVPVIDVDVAVNINADKQGERGEGQQYPYHELSEESCECARTLKGQAEKLGETVAALVTSVETLLMEAYAAANSTAKSFVKSSVSLPDVDAVEDEIKDAVTRLTRAYVRYCYWKTYYFWWFSSFSWTKYVCEDRYTYGRKRRAAEGFESDDEELKPYCIASNLADVIDTITDEANKVMALKDQVLLGDAAFSAYVINLFESNIDFLKDQVTRAKDLAEDLEELPC